jgi:hypothetical protein
MSRAGVLETLRLVFDSGGAPDRMVDLGCPGGLR